MKPIETKRKEALARREKDLKKWKAHSTTEVDEEYIKAKVTTCESDIENLRKKLHTVLR